MVELVQTCLVDWFGILKKNVHIIIDNYMHTSHIIFKFLIELKLILNL